MTAATNAETGVSASSLFVPLAKVCVGKACEWFPKASSVDFCDISGFGEWAATFPCQTWGRRVAVTDQPKRRNVRKRPHIWDQPRSRHLVELHGLLLGRGSECQLPPIHRDSRSIKVHRPANAPRATMARIHLLVLLLAAFIALASASCK